MSSPLLDAIINGLSGWDYEPTSEPTYEYNCIAWAADDKSRWWWPGSAPYCYWPEGALNEESVAAFVSAYETIGYRTCDDGAFDPGCEKIAIYIDEGGKPRHAAKQVDDVYWTSKLGAYHDIKHPLRALEIEYGRATVFMQRQRVSIGTQG